MGLTTKRLASSEERFTETRSARPDAISSATELDVCALGVGGVLGLGGADATKAPVRGADGLIEARSVAGARDARTLDGPELEDDALGGAGATGAAATASFSLSLSLSLSSSECLALSAAATFSLSFFLSTEADGVAGDTLGGEGVGCPAALPAGSGGGCDTRTEG